MSLKEAINLDIDSAIKIVSGHQTSADLARAEIFFTVRLDEFLADDYEGRAECYYYLLLCKLKRNTIYETQDLKDLYFRMLDFLKRAERKNLEKHKKETSQITQRQLTAFYQITEHKLSSLEQAYKHRHLTRSMRRTNEDKMRFRKAYYLQKKSYLKCFGYVLLDLTSKYGNSFGRWGVTSLLTIIFFAYVYFLLDQINPDNRVVVEGINNWYNYPYFSVVTFTTLGYGDITPLSWMHKIVAGTEAFSGYAMLGIFVNLLNRRL